LEILQQLPGRDREIPDLDQIFDFYEGISSTGTIFPALFEMGALSEFVAEWPKDTKIEN
jgi:hypothetical protein